MGMAKLAALDSAAEGFKINAIYPGIVETPMMDLFSGDIAETRALIVGGG